MAKRMTLLGLADRCEREEPSRALRYEIAEALGLSVDPAPRMLDSLDAAVSLMSNDYEWAVDDGGEASARNVQTGVQSTGFVMDRPAAALTAAALRALAQEAK